MAAIWGRAWRSMASHEGGDDGRSLQPTAGGERGSTSGTNYSTTTTHTTNMSERSLAFHPFTVLPTATVLEENADELGEEERVKKLEHIKSLVVLFCKDNNNSATERWLYELGVNWVLHLSHVSESGRSFISGQLLYLAGSWIEALFEINHYISVCFGGHLGKEKATTDDVGYEFLRFVQATLSKMLPFVDAIVAVRVSGRRGAGEPADEKLRALILVRDALSMASAQIMSSFSSSPCCEGYLSADLLARLDEAIWDTMEEANFSSCSRGTQRSPSIHKGTLSVINCINVLWANYGSVNRIIHDAFLRGEFVPENENVSHLINLTIQMARSLEEMVIRNSQSFPNQSLKFLFLINNFYFILQQLHTHCPLVFPIREHVGKIDSYIHSYIQVSWAPVSECLRNPTPCCFTRRSPLPRFESKFQQTYTVQKLWKVPAPEMRKRLRNAIVEEVIPVFTQFLKDNSNSTPRVTPQEMTKLLSGLFEG
ncbi:hypothetical protein EJB05_08723, partial [Eragrostis curvula]